MGTSDLVSGRSLDPRPYEQQAAYCASYLLKRNVRTIHTRYDLLFCTG